MANIASRAKKRNRSWCGVQDRIAQGVLPGSNRAGEPHTVTNTATVPWNDFNSGSALNLLQVKKFLQGFLDSNYLRVMGIFNKHCEANTVRPRGHVNAMALKGPAVMGRLFSAGQ